MPPKTKKLKKSTGNNKTQKKNHFHETAFKIDGIVLLGTDGHKLRLRQRRNPINSPITRKLNRGKDFWREEDIIKFDYLIKKRKKRSGNYILSDEDKINIKNLL